jgi:NadR type nicotinamide-nucleotide adenylyltransferase
MAAPPRPKRGLVLGKFMPPHLGHCHLVDFARAYVAELTVLVCSIEREPIPGRLRFEWMKRLFPDCRVVHVTDEVPQAPEDHPDFWLIWRALLRREAPQGFDIFFSSEPYGERVAAEMGAMHLPVDPERKVVPISGQQIREAPMSHWNMIAQPARPYFLKRVSIFGPESTGKSRLAERLGVHYGTLHVPEFARTYLDPKNGACEPADIEVIARGQMAAEAAVAERARKILFCDTDVLLTSLWSRMLFGDCPAWIDETAAGQQYHLTLLTDIDAPWVDDGQRYFPDAEPRERFFRLCEEALERSGRRTLRLSGDWDARFNTACGAVETLLAET